MLDLFCVQHESGLAFAAAFHGDRLAYASGPLEPDELEVSRLSEFEYSDDELALWLAREYDRGAATRIAAAFQFSV